jgi:hypothetical protein
MDDDVLLKASEISRLETRCENDLGCYSQHSAVGQN